MTRKQIFSLFFFGIFLLLIYLFYEIIKPFIFSLFWAGILALFLYPVHLRLTRVIKNKAGLSSIIMTTLATFLVVLPLVLIVTTLAIEMFDAYQEVSARIEITKLRSIVEHVKGLIPINILEEIQKRFDLSEMRVEEAVLKGMGTISSYLFNQIQKGATNLTILIVNFGIMVFALFFFFRDGKRLYEELKYLIPMTDEQKDRIFRRFYDILNAVIIGVMVTAGVQGLVAGLIFWILGISFPVLAGVLTFVFSLIPVGGAAVVWLPVAIYLILAGSTFKGIALLILGAIVVSSVDNFLKPMIIGGRTKLPTLFLFISIFGGIKSFGFSGIILGPVLLAVFLSFIEIYRVEYREAKLE
ncbi:MAG TPA: AI-2E family transporter [Thermodesulfobacteriota bacterium]|jgi:predicted PurR-regulated permease PerM